jgi:hypothetical protein
MKLGLAMVGKTECAQIERRARNDVLANAEISERLVLELK